MQKGYLLQGMWDGKPTLQIYQIKKNNIVEKNNPTTLLSLSESYENKVCYNFSQLVAGMRLVELREKHGIADEDPIPYHILVEKQDA